MGERTKSWTQLRSPHTLLLLIADSQEAENISRFKIGLLNGPGFNRHAAEPITKEIYEKYSKFFIGVPKYDKW